MNTPKIPAIVIRIWKYRCFFYADVFDETKRFRGDCLSYQMEDIDSFVAEWSTKAIQVTIEDTVRMPTAA